MNDCPQGWCQVFFLLIFLIQNVFPAELRIVIGRSFTSESHSKPFTHSSWAKPNPKAKWSNVSNFGSGAQQGGDIA
jgi:hypothetical protein